jgi:hypothetical protein
MSMVQAPLPTGMPANVASYCASSLPWALAAGEANSAHAPAQRPANTRSAELAVRGEIVWSVFTRGGPASRAIDQSFKQKWPANNGPARFLGKSAGAHAGTLDVGAEYAVYMMA